MASFSGRSVACRFHLECIPRGTRLLMYTNNLEIPKVYTGRSATRGKVLLVSSPWQTKIRRDAEYRPTGADNNKCRKCIIPSYSIWIKETHSNPRTRSNLEDRCPKEEWSPRPDHFSIDSYPPSYLVTRNRSNSACTRSPGCLPVLSTSPTNRGNLGGSESTMTFGGWASVSRRHHRLSWGLRMGEFPTPWAWS